MSNWKTPSWSCWLFWDWVFLFWRWQTNWGVCFSKKQKEIDFTLLAILFNPWVTVLWVFFLDYWQPTQILLALHESLLSCKCVLEPGIESILIFVPSSWPSPVYLASCVFYRVKELCCQTPGKQYMWLLMQQIGEGSSFQNLRAVHSLMRSPSPATSPCSMLLHHGNNVSTSQLRGVSEEDFSFPEGTLEVTQTLDAPLLSLQSHCMSRVSAASSIIILFWGQH